MMDIIKALKDNYKKTVIDGGKTDSIDEVEHKEIVKPSKVLLEWESNERPAIQYSQEFLKRSAILAAFFVLMFLVLKDWWIAISIAIVYVVVYVFLSVPPKKIRHKITTNGVNFASEVTYTWKELKGFYFENKNGVDILVFDTVSPIPGRLFLLLEGGVTKDQVLSTVNQYISVIEEPEVGIIDKITQQISDKLNFK